MNYFTWQLAKINRIQVSLTRKKINLKNCLIIHILN